MTEELTEQPAETQEAVVETTIDETVTEDTIPVETEQGIELGSTSEPREVIEPRAFDRDNECPEEDVELLTPMCGCTPAGCSWEHCDETDPLPVEESWQEIGEPLVIEAEELAEVDAAPAVPQAEAVVPVSSPAMLAETGAPVDGWGLVVVGVALLAGGATVAASRWVKAWRADEQAER